MKVTKLFMGIKEGKYMNMKLVTGEEYDSVVVEHVIVIDIEKGLTDEQILRQFDESSRNEVKKRLDFFRAGKGIIKV
jgi:hypothetical protein